jgi:aspartate kinase
MAEHGATGAIVMKFGGTSLATPQARAQAAARVGERVAEGHPVVVVVSAMGRSGDAYATDTLLGLVREFPATPPREIDALLACGEEISAAVFAGLLRQQGLPAVSLRGFQAGILTDGRHRDAEIRAIRPAGIEQHLERGEVVVVAGFQGVTEEGEITTLGRGGSDTTAVALGAALEACRVEIFTDVDGVLTADPRVVAGARQVPEVTYHESAELAFKGAQVLHPRAAERARASRVPVEIRSTFSSAAGTWLVPDEGRWSPEGDLPPRTTAVTSACGIAQVRIAGDDLRATPERQERLFGAIAARQISIDMISIGPERVAFTVPCARVGDVEAVLAELGLPAHVDRGCAKVTLVGGGIHGIPGVMHRIVRALAGEGIAILQSVDSNMIISVLIAAEREQAAVRAVHREFFETQEQGRGAFGANPPAGPPGGRPHP